MGCRPTNGTSTILEQWRPVDDWPDRGAVLWRDFWLRASRIPDLWSVPFDPSRPVETPNTVNTAGTEIRQVLADAVLRLAQLRLPGCGNVEGCHEITAATDSGLPWDDGRFGAVTTGSGFVMAARLTSGGPVARTPLTYGESTDPALRHGDQMVLPGSEKWVVDRFDEADIVAGPRLFMSVLCGRGA